MSNLITKACCFAGMAHADQVRKYTGDPYIVHPAEVAEIVSGVTDDEEVIAAAWLHDTVEDTDATLEMVEAEFGARVAMFVEMLTDVSVPGDGNRKARKAIDVAHTSKACAEAQTIKLADLISNTSSIVQYDPQFAVIYLEEKRRLLAVLGDGDTRLFTRATELACKA